MSEQRPVPSDLPAYEAAAVRQTGASPLRPSDPRRVGPYVPLGLLGSGGMGRVYLARPADDTPGLVAVKVIRPEYAEDVRFRRRFEREASVHAQVRTPRIPRLCGTGFQDELLWMATEYLPGLDLAQAVREGGALEPSGVWRLVAELGQALADLAAREIVHRDLKPSNVLLSVRGAHVIDFGISKAADASAITATGNRVGTPAYMSPEHLREGRSDTASDVFSLAGTLVYAATGRAPFGDGTGVDVMHRVAFEEPSPALIGEISTVDPALGSLLYACLAKEPERRPTPEELVDEAGAHALASLWPEPLGGKVLERQRACEALHRLPAERTTRRSPDGRPETMPPTPAQWAPRSAPPASHPERPRVVPAGRTGAGPARAGEPADPRDVSPAAVTPPEHSASAGARTWARGKPALAVAAGVTVCAVAASVLVFIRQDTPASASSRGADAATAAATVPGDATGPSAPGTSKGASVPGTSGQAADGAVSPPEVSTSAEESRRNDPPPPTAAPGTPADPTPSTSSPPPKQPETPSWVSDCTHYSGNGRTRKGDSGRRVLQVQCILTERGYGVGSTGVDGEFGPGTESAVRSFQGDKGLAADGVVGRETWAALRGAE